MPVNAPRHTPRLYSIRPSTRHHGASINTRNIHRDAILEAPSSSPSTSASPIVHRAPTPRPATAGNRSPTTRPLRMIMFGKPGAGKGTLSAKLVERYDVEPISTGDLLRAEVRAQTELGKEVEAVMARGGIVNDHLVLRLVSNKLDDLRKRGVHNWILDGFPRSLGQGQLLDPLLRRIRAPLNLIINLDVPDEVILSRIADRWIHLPSGRVYNLGYNKPMVPGLDDITREPLSKRPDDRPGVAAKRLATFYETTSPLLDYYAAQAVTPCSVSSSSLSSKLSSLTVVPTQPRQPTHAAGAERLILQSVAGRTSDEIWPRLEETVVQYFGVEERRAGGSGPNGIGGAKTSSRKVGREIDISSVEIIDKTGSEDVRASAATSA